MASTLWTSWPSPSTEFFRVNRCSFPTIRLWLRENYKST